MECNDKKCMICRTENVWLDSLYCYQCYLKETQPRPRMNYHLANKNTEYALCDLMIAKQKSTIAPKKKDKKKKISNSRK